MLEFVDQTKTSFGKRKIRDWTARPLFSITSITERQDAVQFLIGHPDVGERMRLLLKKLPDLERAMLRIHANGQVKKVTAIMYENVSAKQLELFLSTLAGFASIADLLREFANLTAGEAGIEKGTRLYSLTHTESEGGLVPDFETKLNHIRQSFDPKQAKLDGKIKPHEGLIPEYDECVAQIKEVNKELKQYLDGLKSKFGDHSLKWIHQNKLRYQVEMPITESVNAVLFGGKDAITALTELMSRDAKPEVE